MKDYIFYPFSLSKWSNKAAKWGKKHLGDHLGKMLPICFANLLIFFIVGVWHGSEARYIVYGLYNGVIIALSNLLSPVYKKGFKIFHINSESRIWKGFQILRTFILVNIGWVFDVSVSEYTDICYNWIRDKRFCDNRNRVYSCLNCQYN